MFILIVVATFCALLTGFHFGRRAVHSTGAAASKPPISSVVAAMLALLAFLLALTFNAASARYEVRKKLLVENVNTVGTAYLYADFLQEQDRSQAKALLREYVDVSLLIRENPEQINELLAKTNLLQKQLWEIATSYPKDGTATMLAGRFADSLTSMFDIHNKQVAYSLIFHIHPAIWSALFSIGLLSLGALGFQFGISGGTRYQISFLLAFCFGVILLLIVDLERPGDGIIRIDPTPLKVLRLGMD
jgi:hypothetical protein